MKYRILLTCTDPAGIDSINEWVANDANDWYKFFNSEEEANDWIFYHSVEYKDAWYIKKGFTVEYRVVEESIAERM